MKHETFFKHPRQFRIPNAILTDKAEVARTSLFKCIYVNVQAGFCHAIFIARNRVWSSILVEKHYLSRCLSRSLPYYIYLILITYKGRFLKFISNWNQTNLIYKEQTSKFFALPRKKFVLGLVMQRHAWWNCRVGCTIRARYSHISDMAGKRINQNSFTCITQRIMYNIRASDLCTLCPRLQKEVYSCLQLIVQFYLNGSCHRIAIHQANRVYVW